MDCDNLIGEVVRDLDATQVTCLRLHPRGKPCVIVIFLMGKFISGSMHTMWKRICNTHKGLATVK